MSNCSASVKIKVTLLNNLGFSPTSTVMSRDIDLDYKSDTKGHNPIEEDWQVLRYSNVLG